MKNLLLLAVCLGISLQGCSGLRHDNRGYYPQGGTAVPNNQPYPDVFFKNYGTNPFIDTEDDNLSTFSIDVDTASYAIARRYLQDGNLPPEEAVRIEEFINYFDYDYPAPAGNDPVAISLEGSPSVFSSGRMMLRIGLKAKEIRESRRKNAVLTFVIDTSGSMDMENRLELVKKCLRMLVDNLEEEDRVAIVVYHSSAEVILEHTGLENRDEILNAIKRLRPGGSTFAESGLKLGYKLASENFEKGCINRVILCSDGVANVGQTGAAGILKEIRRHAGKGIYLSTFGFGMGNYNDILMEQLADKGNGSYAYIDDIEEGRRVFDESMTELLQVMAKDVKVQVEFNPETVRNYRLIGYENRGIKDENFRDEDQDAGEMNSGMAVTALYELKLWKENAGRVAKVRVNYKNPDNDEASELSESFSAGDFAESFEESSDSFKLAAVTAEFAGILHKSPWSEAKNLKKVTSVINELSAHGRYRDDEKVDELADMASMSSRLIRNSGREDDDEANVPESYWYNNDDILKLDPAVSEDGHTDDEEEPDIIIEKQNTFMDNRGFWDKVAFSAGPEYVLFDQDLGINNAFGGAIRIGYTKRHIYRQSDFMRWPDESNKRIYWNELMPYIKFSAISTDTEKGHSTAGVNSFSAGLCSAGNAYANPDGTGVNIGLGLKDFSGGDYKDISPFAEIGWVSKHIYSNKASAIFMLGAESVFSSAPEGYTHTYWNLVCSFSMELCF